MKKIFTFLLIALVAISVNAAGVMICGKAYNENSYQLINQELTEAGYLKSGSVAYDPVNYKLTLNNADILCDKTIIETYQLEELEIEVIGNCTLKTKKEGNETVDNGLSCINVSAANTKPMTIDFTGNGSLKMTSTNIAFFAFNRYSVQYKFDGPDVTIKSARGIWSTSVYRVAYKMNAGSLKIWSDFGAIVHAFNMDNGVYGTMSFASGIKILEPYDGYWDCVLPQNGYAMIRHFAGEAKTVKIGSTYDLKVGGVQVTTQNCNDILGDGKVSYFQTNNFLTLNNATIEDDYQVIVSDIQWLKIRIAGYNRLITHHNTYGIDLTECDGVAIEGAGNGVENDVLSMESSVNQMGIGYFTHKKGEPAQTYIRNCSITMPAGEIQNEDNDCALTIENAYIHLADGYISTPPALTLNNCYISKPVGGHVGDYGEICANGSNGTYWGEIEIMPGTAPTPVVVGDVNGDGEVTASDVTALYNFLLNNDSSSLVNGDQNGDGSITSGDVTIVYSVLLGDN